MTVQDMGFLIDMLSASIATSLASTFTAPIHNVKLIISTQTANPLIRVGQLPPYKGIFDCIARIPKEYGIGFFWRGNLSNITRSLILPRIALGFGFNEQIKSFLPPGMVHSNREQTFRIFLKHFACGSIAGAGSLLVTYQLENKWMFRNSTQQRFSPLLLSIMVYRGTYFGLFDTLKENYLDHKSADVENNPTGGSRASKLLVAWITSTIAAYAHHPFDTVRRRLLLGSGRSIGTCFKEILLGEGIVAFFKGVGPLYVGTIHATVTLFCYDEIRLMFNNSL